MNFVPLLQTTQDRNGVFHARLADINLLEAAFERCVFLNIFLVFIQRRRANATQVTARQCRLQHVRSVDCAFSRAGADQRV